MSCSNETMPIIHRCNDIPTKERVDKIRIVRVSKKSKAIDKTSSPVLDIDKNGKSKTWFMFQGIKQISDLGLYVRVSKVVYRVPRKKKKRMIREAKKMIFLRFCNSGLP